VYSTTKLYLSHFLFIYIEFNNLDKEEEDNTAKKRGVVCLSRFGDINLGNVSGIEDIEEENSGDEKSPKIAEIKRKKKARNITDKKGIFIVHNASTNKDKRRVYNIPSNINNLKQHLSSSRSGLRASKNVREFRSLSPHDNKNVRISLNLIY
jgi:hypothetical protein